HAVHGSGDVEAAVAVGDRGGLGEQQSTGSGEGSSVGVVAYASFADPDCGGAVVGQQHHGLVGDGGAGAEHDDAQGGGGEVDGAGVVGGGDRVGVAVDEAAFQVEEGESVPGAGEVG